MMEGVEKETIMETIFLSVTSIAMLIVFSVDVKRKRNEFLKRKNS